MSIEAAIDKAIDDWVIDSDGREELRNAILQLFKVYSQSLVVGELRKAKKFNLTIHGKVIDEMLETYFDDRIAELAAASPSQGGAETGVENGNL